MEAQDLYDLRDETEFCGGDDLHEFFEEEIGDPSPSGKAEISAASARRFVGAQTAKMLRLCNNDNKIAAIARIARARASKWM